MLFVQLINVKMPTTVGILTFMSRKNFMLSWVEHKLIFITSGPDTHHIFWRHTHTWCLLEQPLRTLRTYPGSRQNSCHLNHPQRIPDIFFHKMDSPEIKKKTTRSCITLSMTAVLNSNSYVRAISRVWMLLSYSISKQFSLYFFPARTSCLIYGPSYENLPWCMQKKPHLFVLTVWSRIFVILYGYVFKVIYYTDKINRNTCIVGSSYNTPLCYLYLG